MPTTSTPVSGEVRGDAVYTFQEFERRLQLGKSAIRRARRQGLIVHYVGRRGYIIGRDFIAYLDSHRSDPRP